METLHGREVPETYSKGTDSANVDSFDFAIPSDFAEFKSYNPRSTQPSTLRGTVNEYQLSGRVIIINGDGGCRR